MCSEAPWLAALVMASRTMRSRFSRTSPDTSTSSANWRSQATPRREPRSSTVCEMASSSDWGCETDSTVMARRASSSARSAAPASARASWGAAVPAAAPRVLLAMKASSWARPSCSSRAMRRRSSTVACSSSLRWAAQLESASSRKWPEGDAAVEALLRNGRAPGGDGQDAVQLAVGTDRDPGAVRDAGGVEDGPQRRARLVRVERRGDRLERGHRVAQAGMLLHRPAALDVVPASSSWASTMTMPSSIRKYDARRISDPAGPAMPRASRAPSAVICGGSDSCTSSLTAALSASSCCSNLAVRVFDSTSRPRRRWMATESMAATAPVRNSRRTSVVVSRRAGRGDEGHRQEGAQDEGDADGSLPTLAVEGDADERHEEQDPEPAAHAVDGDHEERHRGHVERPIRRRRSWGACRGGAAAGRGARG